MPLAVWINYRLRLSESDLVYDGRIKRRAAHGSGTLPSTVRGYPVIAYTRLANRERITAIAMRGGLVDKWLDVEICSRRSVASANTCGRVASEKSITRVASH